VTVQQRVRTRVVGLLVGAALAVTMGAAAPRLTRSGPDGDRTAAQPVPASWQRPAVAATDLAERSGVRLVRVTVSGDGGLLDLRFQVVDPGKALAVHEPNTPPAIVDERTGLVLDRLYMGHSHTGAMKAAVTYYLVFDNPGGWVRRGSEVTVLLGNAQVEHVVVA
jgi:hypothetical protein